MAIIDSPDREEEAQAEHGYHNEGEVARKGCRMRADTRTCSFPTDDKSKNSI
jgi:hypothetical protein